MKNDDLSKVKHIGAARMKQLYNSGITTFDQLCEIPLEKLARIDTIGGHYAKLIKDAVLNYCKPVQKTAPAAASADKPPNKTKPDQRFQKQVKLLRRRIKQTNEKLKPLGNKKYLALYVDAKKRSKRLTARLKAVARTEGDLSEKGKKKITEKAEGLNSALKTVGKKPKKKVYRQVSQQLKSFTELLEKTGS